MDHMLNYNGIDRIHHVLKFAGWAFNPNWSRTRKISHKCFGAIVYLSLIALLASDINSLQKLIQDKKYEMVFAGLGEMQCEISGLLYGFLFIALAEKIQAFNTALKETFKFAHKYSLQETASNFPQNWQLSEKCLNAIIWYFTALASIWIIAPFLDVISSYPDTDYQNSRLIFNNADFGLDKKTYFWQIMALHLVNAVILITAIAFGTALVPLVCILIRGQVLILMRSFDRVPVPLLTFEPWKKVHTGTTVGSKKKPSAGLNPRKTLIAIRDRTRFKDDSVDLWDCIKHHQMILRMLKVSQASLEPFLFLEITLSAISLMNCAVAATLAETSGIILLYSTTAAMLVFQMCFITWNVTSLKDMCSEVSFAALSISQKHPQKWRELSLIIGRSNREETFPCILTASLTFTGIFKVMRFSWSYLTLWRQKINT